MLDVFLGINLIFNRNYFHQDLPDTYSGLLQTSEIEKFTIIDNFRSPGYTFDLRAAIYETLFLSKVKSTSPVEKDLFKLSSTSEKCSVECFLPSIITLSVNDYTTILLLKQDLKIYGICYWKVSWKYFIQWKIA